MEYKRARAGKEVGTTPEAMNEQVADEIDARGEPHKSVPGAEHVPNLPLFVAYSVAIVIAAILLCCLAAVLAMLWIAATQGRDGLADFTTQYRFDLGLRARVGAAVLSGFYASVTLATLVAARWAGGARWRPLVAINPIKPGRGRTLAMSIVTLIYAAAMTFAIVRAQNHNLIDSGPTDVVLLGTLLTNLCILAPVAEELFFRGWLYTALRARFAFWPSYLVTTALFAAIHWYASVAHILKVLPLAVVLGLVREWKGSVKPTIALHTVYNMTIVVITLVET